MKGRKPKPIEQRRKEGNAGKRPVPEALLVAGRPDLQELAEPPEHLPKMAKEFWTSTIVKLAEVGILDRVDVPVLEMLASQYAMVRGSQKVLDEDGYFVRGSVGQIRPHPALKIHNDATDRFLKLAEHYALTPIARTRLGLAELHRRSLKKELEDAGLSGGASLRKVGEEPILTSDDGDEIDQVVDAEVVR